MLDGTGDGSLDARSYTRGDFRLVGLVDAADLDAAPLEGRRPFAAQRDPAS